MLLDSNHQSPLPLKDRDVSKLLYRRDASALEDLIEWYRPLLKAIANRDLDFLLRRKVDASDVVQETCQDVARCFQRLDVKNRNQFFGYLKTILKNKISDCRRRFLISKKRSVYRELPISDLDPDHCNGFASVELSPIDKLLVDENSDRLKVLLGRLPSELRRLLWWRFYKELTYREIGLKLSRSDDDVRMLIQRCLARMRSEVLTHDSTR